MSEPAHDRQAKVDPRPTAIVDAIVAATGLDRWRIKAVDLESVPSIPVDGPPDDIQPVAMATVTVTLTFLERDEVISAAQIGHLTTDNLPGRIGPEGITLDGTTTPWATQAQR